MSRLRLEDKQLEPKDEINWNRTATNRLKVSPNEIMGINEEANQVVIRSRQMRRSNMTRAERPQRSRRHRSRANLDNQQHQTTVISRPRHKNGFDRCLSLITASLLFSMASFMAAPSSWRQAEALHITHFRVPAFVPSNLATAAAHSHELAKPILFDCDYDYKPDEDERLTVKWFKNKEAEPFYQWLPELNVRHFADWIRPLVNQSFVSDPRDPLKRFRSLLIKQLSMNLTGQYTCMVSSLAGQDLRQASLVVYQPPRSFAFEHRIYPAPASFLAPAGPLQFPQAPPHTPPAYFAAPSRFMPSASLQNGSSATFEMPFMRPPPPPPPGGVAGSHQAASPTQFKGVPGGANWPSGPIPSGHQIASSSAAAAAATPQLQPAATIVRPPNNNNHQDQSLPQTSTSSGQQQQQQQQQQQASTKIVYTHDGRPIRRKLRKRRQLDNSNYSPATQDQQAAQISSWQLRKRLLSAAGPEAPYDPPPPQSQSYAIQLHHFQCQATQVSPRPMMVLTVKRGAEAIMQYLHESSLVSIRPYQVSQRDLFSANGLASALSPPAQDTQDQLTVTLYDITVSASVALNVSLPGPNHRDQNSRTSPSESADSGPMEERAMSHRYNHQQQQQPIGINTILNFRRGQRMLFECHLELTGTEFEQRKRININEEEVYQFAEAEELRRRQRLRLQLEQQQLQNNAKGQQQQDYSSSNSVLQLGFGSGPPGSSAYPSAGNALRLICRQGASSVWFSLMVVVVVAQVAQLVLRSRDATWRRRAP